ncbi:hypothetical protein BKA70DRAFT_1102195 [Coprinopsis sp. MPI-PUGE-AT-0042]|nr:hypothetical protein BKA70DRAFT_1102195 [Coprinopsis sp. MPI-PUGE-AT-0042]
MASAETSPAIPALIPRLGAYVVLYLLAMYVMTSGRGRSQSRGNTVFFVVVNMMFYLTTLHVAFNFHRVIRAYGGLVPNPRGPIGYIEDALRWDNQAHTYMLSVMIWLGDGLAIYRCWIVWARNWKVIALPLVLYVGCIVDSILLFAWSSTMFVTFVEIQPAIDITYPLNFTQNVLTTGLIAWKIWRQHRESTGAGLIDHGTAPTLMRVIRVIIESAALYTVQLFIIIILYFTGHPAQWVVQMSMFPSMGMIFVIMAVRLHLVQNEEVIRKSGIRSLAPSWLADTVQFNHNSSSGETSGESVPLEVISTGSMPRMHGLGSQASEIFLSSKAVEVSHG